MSENKNNTPGCNCCQDDHEAVIHNLREIVQNLDSCCNNRGTIIKNQKGEIDKLRESNRALHEENEKLKRKNEVVRGMQSKVAKQANEIKRLTEERSTAMSLFHKAESDKLQLHSVIFDKDTALAGLQSKVEKQSNKIENLTAEVAFAQNLVRKYNSDNDELHSAISNKDFAIKEIAERSKALRDALDQASKDAKDNFERGKVKGMEELWASLQWAQDRLKRGDLLFPVYRYYSMAACVDNLTATAFLRKTLEYQEKEAHDITIGDEVIRISQFGSDDSECFIVYSIEEKADGTIIYHSIGSGNSFSFSNEAIADGSVRKTGMHYDSVPFDYIS